MQGDRIVSSSKPAEVRRIYVRETEASKETIDLRQI